jgi:hypothetical protein
MQRTTKNRCFFYICNVNFILAIFLQIELIFFNIIRIITSLLIILVLIGTIIEIYKLLRTQKKAHNKFKNETNNILILENKVFQEVDVIEENNIEDFQLENDESEIIKNDNDNNNNKNNISNDSKMVKKDYNTIKKESSVIIKDSDKKSNITIFIYHFS